jgi:hypothetical protein
MEHKMYCVYVSESPITAIKVERKEDANEVVKLSSGKYVCVSEVITTY